MIYVRYRFRSTPNLAENDTNTKYFSRKQEIESLTCVFMILLKNFKKNGQPLEQGIQSQYFENNKFQLVKSDILSQIRALNIFM